MTREQAIAFLGYMMGRIGGGYHPDTPLSEYVDQKGKSMFTKSDLNLFQPAHDEMMATLRSETYTIGLTLLRDTQRL